MLTSDAPPWVTNGSGMPVMGMTPMTIPTLTTSWNRIIEAIPAANSSAERVARAPAGHEDAPQQQHEQREQTTPPMNPSSSASFANTKSVAWTGRKSPWAWVPLVRPLPKQPARPDRDLRLVELVARALGVGRRVEELSSRGLLVVAQDVRPDDRDRSR